MPGAGDRKKGFRIFRAQLGYRFPALCGREIAAGNAAALCDIGLAVSRAKHKIGVALVFLGASFHEAGHFFAALICGARLERLTIDIIGAKMSLCGKLLSYKEEFIIALFGPLVNLIIFALAYPLWKELSGFSLVLGILNLIPAPGFDGGRMLYSVTASRFGCGIADKTSRFFSFAAVFFIWLMGSYLLLRYSSGISVFLLSFALLYGIAKKRE